MTFSIFGFFRAEIYIFLILISWFQIFGARKNAGFSLGDLNFFAPIFGALNSSRNFDAMNVRRDGKLPKETSYLISELWHFGQMRRPRFSRCLLPCDAAHDVKRSVREKRYQRARQIANCFMH